MLLRKQLKGQRKDSNESPRKNGNEHVLNACHSKSPPAQNTVWVTTGVLILLQILLWRLRLIASLKQAFISAGSRWHVKWNACSECPKKKNERNVPKTNKSKPKKGHENHSEVIFLFICCGERKLHILLRLKKKNVSMLSPEFWRTLHKP